MENRAKKSMRLKKSGPFRHTKLHPPTVPPDLVVRPRLLEILDACRSRPLTLVSAGAGYGKSTLVSSWLATNDGVSSWVTLDESDDNLRGFLTCLVAAMEMVAPAALPKTRALIPAWSLPPVSVLARTLVNELDQIERPFVLVLDDIQNIHCQPVYDFLTQVLRHPPESLHLVLIGRRDPFLPISRLRAQSQLVEIRADQLRFTSAETAAFFERALGTKVSLSLAEAWAQRTDGWAAGLRLAALSLNGDQVLAEPQRSGGTARLTAEYLFSEVMERQTPAIRDQLCNCAIVDRFCASLCDALQGEEARGGHDFDGQALIDWLQARNLFLIPLESDGVWFRFCYLFHDLLKRELQRQKSPGFAKVLHGRASVWFEEQGQVEEALRHSLAAGDVDRAARLVERHRQSALDSDQWYVLERWLSLLPEAVIQGRAELLLARAWVLHYHFEYAAIPPLVDQVDALLGDDVGQGPLHGEVAYLRGYCHFLRGEGSESIQYLERALELIPLANQQVRSETELIFGLASQMVGQQEGAVETLNGLLNANPPPRELRKTYLLTTYVFMHVVSGDLTIAESFNRQVREAAMEGRYAQMVAWTDYLEGLIHLYRYELEAAIEPLERAVAQRYIHERRAAVDSAASLAVAYQALGRPEEADATRQLLLEYVNSFHDPYFSALADSLAARLALMRGELEPAVGWLDTPPNSENMLFFLDVPSVTRCRALIAGGSPTSLNEAEGRLRELARINEANHNTCQLIGNLTLLALALEKSGQTEESRVVLGRALTQAQPGGFIFPFLELGQPMVDLLRPVAAEDAGNADFIKRMLAAYHTRSGVAAPAVSQATVEGMGTRRPLPNPLTSREVEVLELLAQGLYQKEIAERLFVSAETVKTHLKHIYQKLGARDRRQAVALGRAQNLLAHAWDASSPSAATV